MITDILTHSAQSMVTDKQLIFTILSMVGNKPVHLTQQNYASHHSVLCIITKKLSTCSKNPVKQMHANLMVLV